MIGLICSIQRSYPFHQLDGQRPQRCVVSRQPRLPTLFRFPRARLPPETLHLLQHGSRRHRDIVCGWNTCCATRSQIHIGETPQRAELRTRQLHSQLVI